MIDANENPATGVRHSASDCRSEHGVTVGLLDALLTTCRVLKQRDLLTSTAVWEALMDIGTDEDVQYVMRWATDAAHRRAA